MKVGDNMAINIKFDLINNPEPPTLILANRNGNKLGQLDVNPESVELIAKFNEASEISFTVNKYVNGKITNLWDKILDFKLVYCKEWDCWFEAKVELDEATESVKTVFCTQLGQAELSQIMLYDIEINTEDDIARDDYKIGILYDPIDSQCILRRLLDKAPHYSIIHVDETIKNIQRSFSFNDISVYDAFQEIAEEIGCLFVFNSDSDANGMPQRTISVYDLQQNCNDCGYRGEFTDACPNLKCPSKQDGYQSKGITYGYGEDTRIFVTSDELASEGIELVTDTDSVKNCFKLEAGDDLMTATIRNRNPNGTDYIWYFSDATKEDMPKELVDKIEEYDKTYQYFYNDFPSFLDDNLLAEYNSLVDKYSVYYNDDDDKLEKISSPIIGFADLMQAYYNTIDLGWYLKSGLMPKITMGKTDAEEQAILLSVSLPPIIAVTDLKYVSKATADSTILSMARAIVNSAYKVNIISSQLSGNNWRGSFSITNYSDEEDTYTTSVIDRTLTDFDETYIRQKIEKVLSKENTDDLSVTGLFAKDYDDFCTELKKYALTPLTSFHDACQACIDILIEQGAGSKDSKGYLETGVQGSLYSQLYLPYYNKLKAIESEIAMRENEVNIILGIYDENGNLTDDGLQTNIEKLKAIIQNSLNFENYLGNDLWLQFCAYRREDKYSNSNYISDGLNNVQLFERALEFYKVAENEIFKSAELQHSISATLNNLLAIPKFKSLVQSFDIGNWIRVQIDERVYKLRLVKYEISYDDFDNISVEFSDVAKTKNGYSDLEDILSNASTMASSYDSIKRQANLGSEARDVIREWLTDGLDASLYNIKNNTNENITIDNNGLIGRTKSDITEEDSPEQIRLTHNIIAYTDDGWNSVKQAIGKHKHMYYDYDKKAFIDAIDYGMSADFVTAGYVTGSQIIGGNIISSNYVPKTKGTYFNLIDGDFEIAGGKLIYDAADNALKLKDVTIQWGGSTNAPEIKDITGLEEYLSELENLEEQLDGRIQTYSQTNDPSENWTQEEYSYHIGDLWINPNDGITKRWTGSSWVVVTDSDLQKLAQSKAQIFTSTPVPPYYVGDLWVQGVSGDILHCIKSSTNGTYNADDWIKSSKYTDDSALNTFINGEYADELQSISNQIDGKARSWYQDTDPSLTWDKKEDHEGDLWYDSKSQITYIRNNNAWKQTSVPQELFDTIDGIASIYITIPDNPVVGDLLIPSSDVGGYKSGKVYRYDGSSWKEISYTDDTKAEEALAEAKKGIEAASNALKDAKTYTDNKDSELSKNLTAAYENYTSTEVGKLDTAVSAYLGWDGETIIDGKHVISPYLGGGYLNITGVDNKIRVLIDPDNLTKNGYVFQVHNGNTSKVVMGVDKDGNAQFNGAINATSLTLGDGVTISTANIDGIDEYAKIGEIPGVPDNIICADDVKISSNTSENGITTTSITVGDKTYTSITDGDFVLTDIGLGIDAENQSYTKISKDGLLTARNALIYGTIYANAGQIGGCTIKDGQLQIGSNNLDENVQNTISDAYWNASAAQLAAQNASTTVAAWTYPGTTEINGSSIRSGTVAASILKGGTVQLLDNFGIECGTITITSAQTANYAFDLTSKAAMRLTSKEGSLYLQGGQETGWGNYINLTEGNTIYIGNAWGAGIFAPASDNSYNLGFPNYKWQDVYSASPVINTSDIREKQNVKYDLDAFDNFFFNLKPTQYQFVNNSSNRYHVGFISQDVEQALTSNGLTSLDFAGFIKSPIYEEDGTTIKDYSYGLRYGEFIALNTHMIQKLYKRISELESKIIELQN